MKQSCYFAKVCDGDFKKNHIGVNIFLLQLCLYDEILKVLCEKCTKHVSKCWGLLLENFRVIT